MTILSLKNVVYTNKRSDITILNDVTIDFLPGKVYGILGKSGAGKSTLLALLAGLDLADSGNIYFNSKNLVDVDRDSYRREELGIIFQRFNLLTNSSVLNTLQMSLGRVEKSKKNKQFFYDSLKKIGLGEKVAHQKVKKLSTSNRQRIYLVNALINDPKIILIDEPAEALSELSLEMVMSFLRIYAKSENKCIILSSQVKTIAENVDELWGLNGGKLSFIKDNAGKLADS